MFPNIVLISHDKNITYHSEKRDKKAGLYSKKLLRNMKRSLKVNIDQQSAIVILNQEYLAYHDLVDDLIKFNINKIFFFIDDVFRIRYKKRVHINLLETHTIEQDFENTIFVELSLIENILTQTNITDFEIFHCEKIPKKLLKKFKYNIKHFDLYLANWIFFKKDEDYSRNLPIDFKVTCFNHRRDWQRHLISALLFDQPDVFLTTSNKYEYSDIIKNPYINVNKYEEPFRSFFLTQIKKYDAEPVSFVDSHGQLVKKNHISEHLDSQVQNANAIYNLTERGFLNLVTETRFYTPMQYISEKSIKPIMVRRPFIILGAPHTLRLLKKMGFKTFNKWWDESYDNETNHSIRFAMVYDLVQNILSNDIKNLENVLSDMDSVLVHNYKNLKNIHTYFLKNLII